MRHFFRPLHGKLYGRAVWGAARLAGAFVPVRQPARFRSPDWRRGAEKQTATKEYCHDSSPRCVRTQHLSRFKLPAKELAGKVEHALERYPDLRPDILVTAFRLYADEENLPGVGLLAERLADFMGAMEKQEMHRRGRK
ncbi:MAG: hypothetical protein HZB71_05640 [Betaproteobacteria bacterium]|nr:hypothetical protein [Betaproteobacteria bacterium]